MAANGILDFQGTNQVNFMGAASNIVIDTVTASLGIGVDVNGPTSNLHVVGNAHVSTNLTIGGNIDFIGNLTQGGAAYGGGSGGSSQWLPTTSGVPADGIYYTAGNVAVDTNTFFVDTVNDRVGVGTTTPDAALDVNGSLRAAYDQDVTSYLGRAAIGYNGATTDAATFSHVDMNNTTDFALKHWSYGGTDINAKSGMGITFRQGGQEVGKFKGNGNFFVDTDTLYVDSVNNRVGIGTSNPQYRLDVGSGGGDVMLRVMNGLATTGKLLFGRTGTADNRSHAIEVRNNGDGDNNYMKFLVHDGGGVSPFEGRTEVMILRGDGRVGIGTSIPDRLFHVNGTSRFVGEVEWLETGQSTSHANYGANRDWYIRSGTADGKVVIQDIHATSNVGIGTSTPGFKLDVTGDINYTGVIRRNGTIQALSSPFSTNGTKAYYTDGPVGIANVSALTTQTLQIGANVVVDDTASDKLVVSGDVFIARSLHAVDLVKTYEVKCNALFIKDVQVTNQVPEDGDLRGYTPGIS